MDQKVCGQVGVPGGRSGQLLGASGVDVNGSLYNVTFQDGICVALFGGCDELSDFAFGGDGEGAAAAAQALLDDVFVGVFDADPTLTVGCGGNQACTSLIPYVLRPNTPNVLARTATNGPGIAPDGVSATEVFNSFDTTTNLTRVYAVFTPVPVPAALPLMLGGLAALGLIGARRSGRQAA